MTIIKIGELRDGIDNLAEHIVDQIDERGPCAVFLGSNGVCALMTPKDPDFIKKEEGLGAIVVNDARANSAEHKKFVQAEVAKWGPVIKAAGQYAD